MSQHERPWAWNVNCFLLLILLILFVVGIETKASNEGQDERLRRWALQNGAVFDRLQWPVNFPQTGRGMAAAEDLQSHEVILRIPLTICIRKESAKGTSIEQFVEQFEEYQAAIVVLMYETLKGNASFYAPFIDYLPKHYDMVEKWTKEELAEFQDPKLPAEAAKRLQLIKEQFSNFKERVNFPRAGLDPVTLESFQNISFDFYSWAWQTLGTRSFGFFDIPGRTRPTLVPVADLMNYNEHAWGVWTDHGDDVVITLGQDTKAGQEIFISYGQDSHFYTMYNYGFINPGNTLNTEEIFFSEKITLYGDKMEANGHTTSFVLRFTVEPFSLMGFSRLLAARTKRDITLSKVPTSWMNEYVALAGMCPLVIDEHLANKGTTLEQDEALFTDLEARQRTNRENETKTARFRTALMYRMDQKRIALRNKRFCMFMVEQVLLCIPSHLVRKPIYLRKAKELAAMYHY